MSGGFWRENRRKKGGRGVAGGSARGAAGKLLPKTDRAALGSVPTTPDPHTSAKVSRYKSSRIVIQIGGVYILLSAKRRAYFCAKVSR